MSKNTHFSEPTVRIAHHHHLARISHHTLNAYTALSNVAVGLRDLALGLVPASVIKAAKSLGIAGIVLTAANHFAVMAAPQYYEPVYNAVTETVGLHPTYTLVSHEPTMTADSQGALEARTKYFYEVRLSDLTSRGIVTGRFRGAAQDGIEVDPEWWLVRGYSDGKQASLTYTDENGVVLGWMNLETSDKGVTWRGALTGVDLSVNALVRSPIMIGDNPYEVTHRLKDDKFLDQPSVTISR